MVFAVILLGAFQVWAGEACDQPSTEQTLASFRSFLAVPFKEVCSDVARVASGRPPANKLICAPLWSEKVSPCLQTQRTQPESLNKTSQEFKEITREQAEAYGIKLKSNDEMQGSINEFERLKDKLAPACCGDDDVCRKSFTAVRIKFCEPAEDPKAPEPCLGSQAGYFTLEEEDLAAQWYNTRSKVIKKTRTDLELWEWIKATGLADRLKEDPFIGQGTVVISPYMSPTEAVRSAYTLQHELGHACSNIRRQLLARRSGAREYQAHPIQRDAFCKARPRKYEEFDFLKRTEESKTFEKIKSCITDEIFSESFKRGSLNYVPRACVGVKVEEAAADLFAATADPRGAIDTMVNLCANCTDAMHFSGASTVNCLVRHSPNYRQSILGDPLCTSH